MKVNFIDCGAHKGQSIIYARSLYGNDLNFYSFEPLPFFSNWLTDYYKNDNKVKIYNKAVWKENIKKMFYISKSKASWGSSLTDRFEKDDTIPIEVECINFSQWVKNNLIKSEYNILKLDIEGAECEVLNKMMDDDTLSYFNNLVGEWHENHGGFTSNKFSQTKKRLRDEYNTEMSIWEAPWYNEESTPGMVIMGSENVIWKK